MYQTDSDELRENGWQCGQTTIYIPKIYVCDGYLDCEAGSDETDKACTALPGQKFFLEYQLMFVYHHESTFRTI